MGRDIQKHLLLDGLNATLSISIRRLSASINSILRAIARCRYKLHRVSRISTIHSWLQSSQSHHLLTLFISHHYVSLLNSNILWLRCHWPLRDLLLLNRLVNMHLLMLTALLLRLMMILIMMIHMNLMLLLLLMLKLMLVIRLCVLITLNGIKFLQNINQHAFLILNISLIGITYKVHIKSSICWTHALSLSIFRV